MLFTISPKLDMFEPEDYAAFIDRCPATFPDVPSPWVNSDQETASIASSSTGASVPATQHLHIAIFDTEQPPVIQPSSPYAFEEIMNRTANRLFGSNLRLHWTVYNVRNNPLPSDNAFFTIHAVMITGSSSWAYNTEAWILNLTARICTAYRRFPHVKWYGSDFGHQIICEALLAEWGYHTGPMRCPGVGKYAEIGLEAVLFHPRFQVALRASEVRTREATAHLLRPASESPVQGHDVVPTLDEVLNRGYMRLHFAHADQVWPPRGPVVLPMHIPGVTGLGQHRDDIPLPFVRNLIYQVGFNQLCGMQGMYVPARIFTLQGRMELSQATAVASVGRFMEDRAYPYAPDMLRRYLERALQLNRGEDNRGWVAERVLWFFLSEPEVLHERLPADIVAGINDDNRLSVLDRVRSGLIHRSRVERIDHSRISVRLDGGPEWLPIPAERPEEPVGGEQAEVVADNEQPAENNEQPADDDQLTQDDEQPEGSGRMAAYLGAAFSIVRWTIRRFYPNRG